MVEYVLVLSLYSNAMASYKAVSINTVPTPFYAEDECTVAGNKIKAGLIEGLSSSTTSVGFVCVKRTTPDNLR